jgi:Glycosyl transferase family 2
MGAPIALFAYRRPQHLRATLDALRSNPEARDSDLHVYSDAPKDAAAAAGVEEVRRLLRDLEGFKSVNVVEREQNFGLARNITTGVSDVLARSERVIVLEDDLVVSPFFLRFMNEALTAYRDSPRIGSVSAYVYPLDRELPETFFIRGADCWGWATWRDRWQTVFNPDGRALLAELRRRRLTHAFDFDGTMGFTRMLEDQIAGKNDSWAVRWHASCFLDGLLILYPSRPLAQNIGRDGSGTHCISPDELYDVRLSPGPVRVGGVPIEESKAGRAAIRAFFRRSEPRPGVLDLARRAAGKIFRLTRRSVSQAG